MKFVSCLSGESIFTLKEAMKNYPNFTVRVRQLIAGFSFSSSPV